MNTFTQTQSFDGVLRQAVAHHQAGRLQEAERLYRSILQAYPEQADANHNMGLLAMQLGQPASGLPYFEKAWKNNPADEQFCLMLADCLLQLDRPDDALRIIKNAMQRNGFRSDQARSLLQLAGSIVSGERPPLSVEHEALALFNAKDHSALEATMTSLTKRYPNWDMGWQLLGLALMSQNKDGLAALRRAVELSPANAEGYYNLGLMLNRQGHISEAEASFRRALEIRPDYAEAHYNLAVMLDDQGRVSEAEAGYRRMLKIRPDCAEAHNNLGIIFQEQDRPKEAEVSFLRALEIRSDYAEAHNGLGNTFRKAGRLDEAEARYRRALQIKPDLAEAHGNLCATLMELKRLPEAGISCRRALEIKPDFAEARQNLATLSAYLSDFDQVVAESDAAMRLKPNDPVIWEQRLYVFSYHPDLTAEQIYGEFVRWGDRFPDPVVDFGAHDRTPGRRLKIGYVSPDFRRHTSRFYFWPLFANHDHTVVESYAYSNVRTEDDVTQEFKGLFDHWRDIRGVEDGEVARTIREDGIDILVDCCNHMRDDRLGVFALKPAPVQATWLGAAWTTGLKMVDYALIDPYMAPEGTLTRETIVRLPHSFVAYRPPEKTAEIAPPPYLENGQITFGYSGRTERLNHRTFRAWGEILRRIPDAKLILDFRGFDDPPTQAHYRQFMARHGMDVSRVIMRRSANIFAGLNDIDILLDCFPHSGGTMLFDALWMGVPALTLASRPPVGRIGASLMTNLGLPEWVAGSEEEYIGKAYAFAQNPGVLGELRAGMRERMENSPLMDGVGFARGVEAAYRTMFEKCVEKWA